MSATEPQGTVGLRACLMVTAAVVVTMAVTVLGGKHFMAVPQLVPPTASARYLPKIAQLEAELAKFKAQPAVSQPDPKVARLEAELAKFKLQPPPPAAATRVITALDLAYKHLAEQSRAHLESTKNDACVVPPFPASGGGNLKNCECLWKDIHVSIPLDAKVIKKSDGRGSVDKAMVRLELMSSGNKKDCVVYGMGIAGDSSFERLAAQHCNTYGFDCTVQENSPVVANQPFTFKKICIGAHTDIGAAGNVYGGGQTNLKFQSLEKVMTDLGHRSVDVLKFDIEGSEWELLEAFTKIKDKQFLPKQLLFEMHTQGVNPRAVPPALVKGKGKLAAHAMMLALHDIGYRAINLDINHDDCTCAEIAMVLMNER